MHRTLVITGGSSGMGAATVQRLLANDCVVYNLDIAEPATSACEYIPCDLSDPVSIGNAIALVPAGLHGVINAAGVAPGGPSAMAVVAINFLGMRHLTERLLPKIIDGGSIVNVASSAGRDWLTRKDLVWALLDTADFAAGVEWLDTHSGDWTPDPYRFSKQCAAAWTYRAVGLGRTRQVRVNCVNPGIVETRLSAQFRQLLGPNRYDWILQQSGRAGTPEDIAAVIEYLAIGDCRWLNGVELTVDGGYYAGIVGGWINPADMP